ncbi:hypothetical protein DEI95_08200 [Curtobacterium sp. MCBD17_008]|nr:hypothetical protein DEI95_08200 [Curtobacterium sp. MCBD17_008]
MTFGDEYGWMVDGEDRSGDSSAVLLDPRELPDITVGELTGTFRAAEAHWGDTDACEALIYNGAEGYLDAQNLVVKATSLVLRDGGLCVRVEFFLDWPTSTLPHHVEDFAGRLAAVRNVITPFLQSRGSSILQLSQHAYGPWQATEDGRFIATIVATQPENADTLADLADLGDGVERLVDALVGGTASRDTLADLIRGGHAGLLVGLPEGNWLDAKSQEWDLTSDGGKYSLGVEVSAFCNAEEGGIIVFGASTDKGPERGSGEIITAVGGLHQVRTQPRTYEQILSDWIFPLPFGLRVDVVTVGEDRPIIMIDIPAQPEELKPFLAKGALSYDGRKVDGKAFTVAQRRGEDTKRLEASMLHAQLAVGRRFLRNLPIDDGPSS